MTANATGGTFAAGAYNYEITAATAYGESEPSTSPPKTATVAANGSVTLTLARRHQRHGHRRHAQGPRWPPKRPSTPGGTGFWGYNIYRENPGATTYGLVGQVAENPAATAAPPTASPTPAPPPGAAPGSGAGLPDRHQPRHRLLECAG